MAKIWLCKLTGLRFFPARYQDYKWAHFAVCIQVLELVEAFFLNAQRSSVWYVLLHPTFVLPVGIRKIKWYQTRVSFYHHLLLFLCYLSYQRSSMMLFDSLKCYIHTYICLSSFPNYTLFALLNHQCRMAS
jgi:hypothetical protein